MSVWSRASRSAAAPSIDSGMASEKRKSLQVYVENGAAYIFLKEQFKN